MRRAPLLLALLVLASGLPLDDDDEDVVGGYGVEEHAAAPGLPLQPHQLQRENLDMKEQPMAALLEVDASEVDVQAVLQAGEAKPEGDRATAAPDTQLVESEGNPFEPVAVSHNTAPDGSPLYSMGHPIPHPDPENLHHPFDTSCPNHCTGHGECVEGLCLCEEGFNGEDCGQAICLNNCTGKGWCQDGVCICREGKAGPDCSGNTCPESCNGNGACEVGVCLCDPEWEGDSCKVPRYGLPGLTKPPDFGFPRFQRLNQTCVVARVPQRLSPSGASLTSVSMSYKNNKTCVQELGDDWASAWEGGLVSEERVMEGAFSGDTVIGDVIDKCSVITVTTTYDSGLVQTADFPGGLVTPPPPPVFEARQVHVKYCQASCSLRGTCWNNTQVDDWGMRYECRCDAPWIVPCCCSKDRVDGRPAARDPLQDDKDPGDTPFNSVPCSADDGCKGCSEKYMLQQWVVVPYGTCIWGGNDCRTRPTEEDAISLDMENVCRAPGLPSIDYYSGADPVVMEEPDPCLVQHRIMGEEGCRNPGLCGNPEICESCKYDVLTFKCYTAATNETATEVENGIVGS